MLGLCLFRRLQIFKHLVVVNLCKGLVMVTDRHKRLGRGQNDEFVDPASHGSDVVLRRDGNRGHQASW